MQQVVGVLRRRTCMVSLDQHPYQHHHDCATSASHPRTCLLTEVPLAHLNYPTQKHLHCCFVNDLQLVQMAQVAQGHSGAAEHRAQAVHFQ